MRNLSLLVLASTACSIDARVADDAGTFATSGPATTASSSVGTSGEASDATTTGDDAESSASTAGASEDDGPRLDVAADTDDVVSGCSGQSPDLIYVMLATTPAEIWSYDPIENVFAPFVTVECPEVEGELTGFTLDRRGTVFLMSREPQDPDIHPLAAMQITELDPEDGTCVIAFHDGMPYTPPSLGTPTSIDCADIAFVSMPDDPDHERLFAHACTGGSFTLVEDRGPLFRMDPADVEPAFEHLSTDDYSSAALAGTGDGRLYAVGGDAKVEGGQIVEYAQDTGATISVAMEPDLDLGDQGGYIALAFYAGDLYAFGANTNPFATTIHRYDLDDDDDTGMHEVTAMPSPENLPGGIVAAASPTCIPVNPEG